MKIKIGTRKSDLAIAQTKIVVEEIKRVHPFALCEIVGISTEGDKILDKPLIEIGGKGVFVSQIEEAIIKGEIDIAIHSGKDLPTELAQGLEIIAVTKREDVRDVIVSRLDKAFSCEDGGIVGTGSARRSGQLMKAYEKIECRGLRGNVPTRLKKMENGEFDAVVLAAAGLNRLNIGSDMYFFQHLDPCEFIPAAAQGIIAVEGKADSPVYDVIKKISHNETEISFKTERLVLNLIGADCHEAVGIYSFIENEDIFIYGFLGNSGIKAVRGKVKEWESLARALAEELI